TTITVRTDTMLKLRQKDPWMSPAWMASYARRAVIERSFGILKGRATGGIQRGWTFQTGHAKTAFALAVAVAVAATNLRTLVRWAERNNNYADPLTLVDTTDY